MLKAMWTKGLLFFFLVALGSGSVKAFRIPHPRAKPNTNLNEILKAAKESSHHKPLKKMAMGPDACAAVQLVTRAEWGALPPKVAPVPIQMPVNMSFVHHSGAGWGCQDLEGCKEQVRDIQRFHMDVRDWNDIGYSFLIGEDGRVYEGRGWGVEGAHTRGYNDAAHGFCVIGDFMEKLPNAKALDALKNILQCGVDEFHVVSDYELFGHRDGGCTDCPGDRLYAEIQRWPRFSDRTIPKHCNQPAVQNHCNNT